MNISYFQTKGRLAAAATMLALLLSMWGCATAPEGPSEADRVRAELTALQSDPSLASRAPVAIRDAETAVIAAENAEDGTELAEHLAFIAQQKVAIAHAQAQQRLYEDERTALRDARDRARLQARADEAEWAREEARRAALVAAESRQEAEALRRQIEELNAKPTERGLVLTLGDVLFETNEYVLKPGAHSELDKLVEFLERYQDRDVRIEGHTDSTGDDSYNQQLSERRAEAVKAYLVSQGIRSRRVATTGRGEIAPIASNNSAGGRQLNRRVEIIIENPDLAAQR